LASFNSTSTEISDVSRIHFALILIRSLLLSLNCGGGFSKFREVFHDFLFFTPLCLFGECWLFATELNVAFRSVLSGAFGLCSKRSTTSDVSRSGIGGFIFWLVF
jgi:hypothetical protein